MAGSHDQGLAVAMFRDGEPGAEQAIPARDMLGPDWQEKVKNGARTCLWSSTLNQYWRQTAMSTIFMHLDHRDGAPGIMTGASFTVEYGHQRRADVSIADMTPIPEG
jgi:hypothetical protein